ncbi:MAG: hypothetical protein OJF60_000436 [Burkholderiaceae bacterium]|jgi:hypothetical protein|nr:MAG: hypothetical protein OJF60_000436 [Burkholderiaceae bacterium]
MLRRIALLLLLANLAYFAWAQGLLQLFGWAPQRQSEPQRMAQQIEPSALELRPPALHGPSVAAAAPQSAAVAASAATVVSCLRAGPFSDEQSAIVRRAAGNSLPDGSWRLDPVVVTPARWIVYLGKYGSADALAAMQTRLEQQGVPATAVANPALAPGLALGSYDSRAAAQRALSQFEQQGAPPAQVVQDRVAQRGQLLTLPAVDDKLRARLDNLQSALAGKPLVACPVNP